MKTMLITGAAGFIGRAACAYYRDRYDIFAVDNMSRHGSLEPNGVRFWYGDFRIATTHLAQVDIVLHLAAQVSVTESLADPFRDFKTNAEGTMHLAKWAASMKKPPVFIYASTNKVYGERRGAHFPILDSAPIDPQTPYGISKATGGLYAQEFLPDTGYDFRQSCIYGEGQVGDENQGWVGHIRRTIREGGKIRCFGDGTQVRDLLHVDDLLRAYDLAIEGKIAAGSYGVGGGPENAVSFRAAVSLLGGEIASYEPWRPKDQRYCVMAADGLRRAHWYPAINAVDRLKAMGAK